MPKETYLRGKRGLLRLAYLRYSWRSWVPEVCVSAKRDLFTRQKRPIEIGIPEILLALLGVIGSAAVADTQLFSLGNVPRCNQGE